MQSMEQRSFQEFKSNIACYNFYESIDSTQARSRCPVNGKGSILGVVFASILNEQESNSQLPDGVCIPGQTGVGRYVKKSIKLEGVLDPQSFLEVFPAWEEFRDSLDTLGFMGAVEPHFRPASLVGGFVLAKVNSSNKKTEGSYFISKKYAELAREVLVSRGSPLIDEATDVSILMSVLRQSHLLDSMLPPSNDLCENQVQQGSEESKEALGRRKRLKYSTPHRKVMPGEDRQVRDNVMTQKDYLESRKSISSRRHAR